MKFTTRDLLWLIALVAVFLAWGMDHWRMDRDNSFLRAVLSVNGIEPKVNRFP